jgi:hypothetical protein
MKAPRLLFMSCALFLAIPALAGDKKPGNRAMIKKMEAVPCGAKERGLTGLGSVFASVGATSVNSEEKLCPQYLLLTDDMEYHVRPLDHKHPVILPVGKEGEFKISKDVMEMRIPDGDRKKRRYQVVAMKPIDHPEALGSDGDKTNYDAHKDDAAKPLADKTSSQKDGVKAPGEPASPPQ